MNVHYTCMYVCIFMNSCSTSASSNIRRVIEWPWETHTVICYFLHTAPPRRWLTGSIDSPRPFIGVYPRVRERVIGFRSTSKVRTYYNAAAIRAYVVCFSNGIYVNNFPAKRIQLLSNESFSAGSWRVRMSWAYYSVRTSEIETFYAREFKIYHFNISRLFPRLQSRSNLVKIDFELINTRSKDTYLQWSQ